MEHRRWWLCWFNKMGCGSSRDLQGFCALYWWVIFNDTCWYGCFKKWGYPQIIHFNRVFHYKPSIWGYPYFWKHPYKKSCTTSRVFEQNLANTLPKTNSSPLKIGHPKRKLVFQPSIFRCENVSFREGSGVRYPSHLVKRFWKKWSLSEYSHISKLKLVIHCRCSTPFKDHRNISEIQVMNINFWAFSTDWKVYHLAIWIYLSLKYHSVMSIGSTIKQAGTRPAWIFTSFRVATSFLIAGGVLDITLRMGLTWLMSLFSETCLFPDVFVRGIICNIYIYMSNIIYIYMYIYMIYNNICIITYRCTYL